MICEFRLEPLFEEMSFVCSGDALDSLKFPIGSTFMYMTYSSEEIKERQMIFRDFLSDDVFCDKMHEAHGQLKRLRDLARNLGDMRKQTNEEMIYSLMELLLFIDSTEALDEAYSSAPKLKSERLKNNFVRIRNLTEDVQYRNLKKWLYSLDHVLRSVKSVTLGVNLDAQLNVSEVGLVSINDQPYVNDKILDRVIRDHQPPKEFTCISTVGIHEDGGIFQKSVININRGLYNTLNDMFKGTLKNLKRYLTGEMQEAVLSLLSIEDELEFILNAVKYVKELKKYGMPLSWPMVSDKTEIARLYNPLLTDKCKAGEIVPSAVGFSDEERIFILTGPNSGGKTVYITAIGHAQIMFQLGLPVCAVSAEMKIYRKLLTHFILPTVKQSESRLVNETSRMKESLEKVDQNTLLLLDETFSSTSAYDAMILAQALIRYLSKIGCNAVYVTHLLDLNGKLCDSHLGVKMLMAAVRNGVRTYEIVQHDGREEISSMARDIAENSGLGFLFDE